jgi:hypothetical protein
MDIIQPSITPKIINNNVILTTPAGSSTFTNGTGTATGSPITLSLGVNTVAVTGAGSFTVVLPAGFMATAISDGAVVAGSPLTLAAGTQTVNVSGTGNIIVTLGFINSIVSVPRIQTGYTYRVTASNPTGSAANLMLQDVYTPDSSVGNPVPTQVTKNRYPLLVPAGAMVDINGHKVSKHMGTLQVMSDTGNINFAYILELE